MRKDTQPHLVKIQIMSWLRQGNCGGLRGSELELGTGDTCNLSSATYRHMEAVQYETDRYSKDFHSDP